MQRRQPIYAIKHIPSGTFGNFYHVPDGTTFIKQLWDKLQHENPRSKHLRYPNDHELVILGHFDEVLGHIMFSSFQIRRLELDIYGNNQTIYNLGKLKQLPRHKVNNWGAV